MSFRFLFEPVEELDAFLSALFADAPLLVALGIALLLGARHASDPDHLVAVTSLVAVEEGDPRSAARLGAWWGAGHALALIALGVPSIAFKTSLPGGLEAGAEKAIGVLILVLAGRVVVKWVRGDYRALVHAHPAGELDRHDNRRHLQRAGGFHHSHVQVRSHRQAASIGLIHGLAGTGTVVVLLIAALPSRLEAALALVVFAPMSIVSMAGCTTIFAWVLTRPMVEPIYRGVLIPALGVFGMAFGVWYTGMA